MKFYLFVILFFSFSLTLSAQCIEFQTEVQSIENYATSAQRNLKKAQKVETLEEAQKYIDKAISQFDVAISSIAQAKDFATSCNCSDGEFTVTNLQSAIFDFRNLCQKASECTSIETLKEANKKNITECDNVLRDISEATSLCAQ